MATATEVAELRRQAGRGHTYGRQSGRGERGTSRGRKEQAGRSGRQGRRKDVREGDREGEDGREGDTNNWGEKDRKRRRRKPGRAEGQDGSCPPLLCSLLSLSCQRKTGTGWKDNARKSGRQGWVLPAAALLVVVVVG